MTPRGMATSTRVQVVFGSKGRQPYEEYLLSDTEAAAQCDERHKGSEGLLYMHYGSIDPHRGSRLGHVALRTCFTPVKSDKCA